MRPLTNSLILRRCPVTSQVTGLFSFPVDSDLQVVKVVVSALMSESLIDNNVFQGQTDSGTSVPVRKPCHFFAFAC
jgi:hypothetical protein